MENVIDWVKIREKELKYQGYEQQDIGLLSLIAKHELSQDMLEYYLTQYIHNSVINKNEHSRKLKEVIELLKCK